MFRGVIAFLIVLCLVGTGSPSVAEGLLSSADKEKYKAAFKAARKSNWSSAKRHSAGADDKLPGKVIRWMEMTRRGANVDFKRYVRFIEANPHWPRQRKLRQRAEEAIRLATPPEDVLDWFSKHVPITTDGRLMLGRALLKAGLRAEAVEVLRDAWVEGSFGRKQERSFLAGYGKLLTQDHHLKRLDRLLWEGHRHQATRMLKHAPKDLRALAEARIRLRRNRRSVGEVLRRVPDELVGNPGLLYERLRWRRRRGRVDQALEILENPPPDLVRADLWWKEREIVTRRVLERGEAARAYELARDHRLEYGADYAEGEWLAGWIALSFLKQPAKALVHFERLYEVVRYPISLARGAYWAARAEEAMGNAFGAREWYGKAAEFDLTYYGQLAAARLDADRLPPEPAGLPQPNAGHVAAFNAHELVRVVLLLEELGQGRYLQPFFDRIAEVFEEPEMKVLAGRLALSLDRPDLAVRLARRSYRRGEPMTSAGYPVIDVPAGGPEQALLLSIARQESNFKTFAKSPSGARGLMQLMPATARAMARRTRVKYSRARLTRDPVYNLKLGRAYIQWLLRKYDGSYVLAVSAYNAGPVAVNRWIRELGDPRTSQIDPVDWIELIQYKETRNYVQRVLESLYVYRRRLSEQQVAYSLHQDLVR